MSRPIPVASLSGALTEGVRRVVGFNIGNVDLDRPASPATSQNGQGRTSLQSAPVGIPLRPHRVDQTDWSIPDMEWRYGKAVWGPKVH